MEGGPPMRLPSGETAMSEPAHEKTEWWRSHPWYGGHLFAENRNNFPAEELRKYNGLYVAWIPDGSDIRASGPDMIDVWKQIEAEGDDPQLYCYEYITDEAFI
jgi:hypothetical protein